MQPDPTWTDIVQAVAVAGQLVVLVVAAVFARKQVGEARQLREAQARPFVVIDFEVKNKAIFIVVSNLGNTLATDVRFEVDPPFKSTMDGYQAKDLKMFREGIPTLAPGKVMQTVFDHFPTRESSGLADVYKVTVKYSDDRRRQLFTERIDLDLDLYRNLVSIRRDEVHHVNETLGKILDEMQKWRGSGGRGLLQMSPRQKRAEGKRLKRELENAWWKRPTGRPRWVSRVLNSVPLRRG